MAPTQALETSKRKFYKLLDNLSTSRANLAASESTIDLHQPISTTAVAEPPPKRSRVSSSASERSFILGEPDRPLTAPGRPRTAASFLSRLKDGSRPNSVRLVGSAGDERPKTSLSTKTKDDAIPAKSTPNYTPYSQPQFLTRLKTFSDVKVWSPKPDVIGEVEWAKRGWVCLGRKDGVDWTKGEKDIVGCRGGCEKRVVLKLMFDAGHGDDVTKSREEWRWDVHLEKELVERYQGLIAGGHEEGCLWRNGGCKDDIYRIRFGDKSQWHKDIKERYTSLEAVAKALPNRLQLPAPANVSEFDQDKIVQIMSRAGLAPTIHTTALVLALFGWTGSTQHTMQMAQCQNCFQRIGLWLYTSASSTKMLPSEESGISDADVLAFDPIDLHRQHCPWKNPSFQNAIGGFEGLAGWEVLTKLVLGGRPKTVGGEVTGDKHSEDLHAPPKSKEEVEKLDKVRDSKLAKLKKALSVKKRKSVA